MLERVLLTVGDAVGGWLYVIAALVVFGESAVLLGMVLPGETALLVVGFFCQNGTLELAVAIPLGVLAAIAGDSVGFEVGRRFGPGLRHSRLGRRVGARRWRAVDRSLEGHAGRAVFLARLGPFVRSIMPFAAGSSRMRYRVFLPWNVAAAVLWAPVSVLVGYVFGDALSTAGQYLTWGPLALVVLLFLGWLTWRWVKRRRRPVGAEDDSGTPDPATALFESATTPDR